MKKQTNKQKTTTEKILMLIFIVMIIIVIVLAVIAINLKNKAEKEKTNITIPIIETNSQSEISVDISEMKKGDTKEYIFKITNYKDKEIIDKKISYNIDITPSDKVSLKLYKNDIKSNIITDSDMLVENNELLKNEKNEDEYRMIIDVIETPEETDNITIKITS